MHLSNTRQLPSTGRSVIPCYSAAKKTNPQILAENHHFCRVHEQNADFAFRTASSGIYQCSEETVRMSATAFTNVFIELDAPRSSGAVSGRFRTGCAARVLIGSVSVTCRCLAVVRVLGPACSGAPFGLFRWISVAHSTTSAVGVSFGVVPEV